MKLVLFYQPTNNLHTLISSNVPVWTDDLLESSASSAPSDAELYTRDSMGNFEYLGFKVTYEMFMDNHKRWYEGREFVTSNMRTGQILYNALSFFRKDLADKLRGSELDPYYKEHGKLGDTLVWLRANW